jgi:dTDP-4-dehydrorhamnose reductase
MFPRKAMETNAWAVLNMLGSYKLIQISTDHVFDGLKGMYKETDTPNPQGWYAISKWLGEKFAQLNPSSLVIRTSFMKDFTFKKAFTDKYASLLWVDDAAEMIYKLIDNQRTGIYHVGGQRKCIYDFVSEKYPDVGKITLAENPLCQAGLPYLKDTSMDTTKYYEELI